MSRLLVFRMGITYALWIMTMSRCWAIKNCSDVLTEAQNNYDAGKMYGIPTLLEPCIASGFTKNEKVRAYRLLTMTYLILENPDKADESYLKILKLDPEYKVGEEEDPIELVYISRKFKTTPILSLNYGKIGANLTYVDIINNYGVGNRVDSEERYSSGLGFQFGAGLEINLNNHMSIGFEALYDQKRYRFENRLFNRDVMTLSETLSFISFPMYFKYTIDRKHHQPFFYAGLNTSMLLSSRGNAAYINRSLATGELPVTDSDIDMGPLRKSIGNALLFGIGTRYRIGYSYISAELRYQIGQNNLLQTDRQYDDGSTDDPANELLYRYAFVSDDFSINSALVLFGFTKPLYRARKIEKGETGRFLKRLFRSKNKK